MKTSTLLQTIKQAVQAIEPEAKIFLYGSRARGDAQPDSDWDLLVLLESKPSPALISQIRRQIYEIEWETGEILCTIVRSKAQWQTPILQATPFWQSVNREAILL
jgi:predicted nucleotidyltransferase